jgi:thiamine transporter ThiT
MDPPITTPASAPSSLHRISLDIAGKNNYGTTPIVFFMLRRWDRKAYDFGLLMGILEMILGSMELESVIKRLKEA